MPARIIDAWNGWYHVNGSTYGIWLRGDERGWPARRHREHVEGDYRNPPPPGAHRVKLLDSKRSMTQPPVRLSPEARLLALNTFVETFYQRGIELIACAIDDHHFHGLARFRLSEAHRPPASIGTRNQPIYALIRHEVGLAKSRSARAISQAGLAPEGGVWARRFKITAITDRHHQLAVANYIARHANQGAATWIITRHHSPDARAAPPKAASDWWHPGGETRPCATILLLRARLFPPTRRPSLVAVGRPRAFGKSLEKCRATREHPHSRATNPLPPCSTNRFIYPLLTVTVRFPRLHPAPPPSSTKSTVTIECQSNRRSACSISVASAHSHTRQTNTLSASHSTCAAPAGIQSRPSTRRHDRWISAP